MNPSWSYNVPQPEHDVPHSIEAVGELETLVGEVLYELNGVSPSP